MKSSFKNIINLDLISNIKNKFQKEQKKSNFFGSFINNVNEEIFGVFVLMSILNILIPLVFDNNIWLSLSIVTIISIIFFTSVVFSKNRKQNNNTNFNYVSKLLPNYIMNQEEIEILNKEINESTKEEIDTLEDILALDSKNALLFDEIEISTHLLYYKIKESSIENVRENKKIILNFIKEKEISNKNKETILELLLQKCQEQTTEEKIELVDKSLSISNEKINEISINKNKNMLLKNI